MTATAESIAHDGPDTWDAVIIGAGLAGGVSACLLARQGLQVLLVEAKPFPRPKVCGGCLNDRALTVLNQSGLGDVLDEIGAQPFDGVEIVLKGRRHRVPAPPGMAVTREPLDAAIVARAKLAGATFLPSTAAHVLPEPSPDCRSVRLGPSADSSPVVNARVVLSCDGLGRPSLAALGGFMAQVSSRSRVGLGAVVDAGELSCYHPSSTLRMVVGRAGYVGFSLCEAGRVSVAAAVDRGMMRADSPPGEVICRLLREAGVEPDEAVRNAAWRGTRPLSQRTKRVSGERLLLLGDAAGYVEPFTGEGMAAALESAWLAAPLAAEACREWRQRIAHQWQSTYTRGVRHQQRACASLAWLLKHPRLAGVALRLVEGWPQLGARAAFSISSRKKTQENTAWPHQSPG